MDISKNAGLEVLAACYGKDSSLNILGKFVLSPLILFVALIWFILDIALTKKPRT